VPLLWSPTRKKTGAIREVGGLERVMLREGVQRTEKNKVRR